MKFETVVACVGQKRDPTYRSPTLRRRREETWPVVFVERGEHCTKGGTSPQILVHI